MAKICVVDERKAKFKAFKVDRDTKAKGDALWYMEQKDSKATSTICWVGSENKAQLKVFFVDRENKAKWNKPHNLQNQL